MASPEQPLAPEKPPAKPLTLQEISELRLKAQQQAGGSSMTGPDWTNAATLILAEQVARLVDHSMNPLVYHNEPTV